VFVSIRTVFLSYQLNSSECIMVFVGKLSKTDCLWTVIFSAIVMRLKNIVDVTK
jgi:hypothetical protein